MSDGLYPPSSRLSVIAHACRWIAAGSAIAAAVAGLAWGTHVAGGPDSYCYLSQAELFAAGHVMHVEPLAALAPWEKGAEAFVPVGHVPAFNRSDASVPMCSPGYPLVMAAVRMLAGRPAMFVVVPALGAIAVWLTFVLGRRIAGNGSGAIAALLMAASPPFLYQVVQPMSDVPAAALWTAALVAAIHPQFTTSLRRSVVGGVITGVAILIRPNLVPLAGVVALVVLCERPLQWHHVIRTWIGFAAGALPAVIVVALLQNAMYGSPFTSGYGSLAFLFTLEHVWPNLQRYPVWLLQTETPIVLLAAFAPWLVTDPAARRRAVWLLTFVVAVFVCYIPYEVFDAWWYLRFVLPAYPALLALTAMALTAVLARTTVPLRWTGFAAVARGGCVSRARRHPAARVWTLGVRESFPTCRRVRRLTTPAECLGDHGAGERKCSVLFGPSDTDVAGSAERGAGPDPGIRPRAWLPSISID